MKRAFHVQHWKEDDEDSMDNLGKLSEWVKGMSPNGLRPLRKRKRCIRYFLSSVPVDGSQKQLEEAQISGVRSGCST